MPIGFVDRVEHLDELRSVVAALGDGRGGQAIAVDGVSGMGKSALLRAFEAEAPAGCRVVSTRCRPGIGPDLMYGPVLDLLLKLGEAEPRRRGRLRRMLGATGQGVVRSAPEVLSAIVPGLGAVFTLGREITEASLDSGSMPFDSLLPFRHAAALRIAEGLLELVRQGPPTVIVIDDVQHIDESSQLVLDQLLRALAREQLAVVLSHASDAAHAGGKESKVEALLHSWAGEGLLRRRTMRGLPQDAIAELVAQRHPAAPPALSRRLAELTGGHAIFVSLCLDEWTPQDGAEVPLPASLSRVVEERLRALTDQDRLLLATAATQGDVFLSHTVAAATGLPHDLVMERLRLIARDHRLVVPATPPAWARWESADCYRFEHRALWSVVYTEQSAEQMRSRHARIAHALGQGPPETMSLERRLEVARHLRHGGPSCLLASADAHFDLARDAATQGLSFAEAERHCEEVIRAVRQLPAGTEGRDRRLVRVVELLLSLTEVRWRGQSTPAGGPDIDALAAEAEAAAARCADPDLVIRATLLRGKTLLATRGLVPSLEKLRAAVELAEEHGDPAALFVARVEYGRQVSKRRLADGLAQLREAERLYASDPRLGGGATPVLQHARNLGEMQLGITLFDSGHLSEALARIGRCVARLREEPLNAELPMALNYLAQVRLGLGDGTGAAEALREALGFEADRGGDSAWHAYNAALLARILADRPETRDEARRLIADAWAETERTWLANLVPIVRNLCAEVLLAGADGDPRAPGAAEALQEAERLAIATCVETRRSGMVRSEIAAYCLRSRIRLRGGDPAGAVEQAREALRMLDEVGDMPALRTEEVLWHAGRALAAYGAGEEARGLLGRARREVLRKAGLIGDEALRERFLTAVPLNRSLLAADGEGTC